MAILRVRCAKCNTLIPTGTEMSYEAFRNATFTQHTVEWPNCESVQTWPDRIRAVTPDAVNAAARAWLDKRRSVTGYLIKDETRRGEKRS